MTMSGRNGAFMVSGRATVVEASVAMSDSRVWIVTKGRAAAVVEDMVERKLSGGKILGFRGYVMLNE